MRNCPKCDFGNPDDADFCEKCGYAFQKGKKRPESFSNTITLLRQYLKEARPRKKGIAKGLEGTGFLIGIFGGPITAGIGGGIGMVIGEAIDAVRNLGLTQEKLLETIECLKLFDSKRQERGSLKSFDEFLRISKSIKIANRVLKQAESNVKWLLRKGILEQKDILTKNNFLAFVKKEISEGKKALDRAYFFERLEQEAPKWEAEQREEKKKRAIAKIERKIEVARAEYWSIQEKIKKAYKEGIISAEVYERKIKEIQDNYRTKMQDYECMQTELSSHR